MKTGFHVRAVVATSLLVLSADAAQAVYMDVVPVGNAGNASDTRYETPGYGAVDYFYYIGKYEVTAGQYTEFLNAIAATDTYGLYSTKMSSEDHGCQIVRNGSPEGYTYSVDPDWEHRPVNFVSWGDAARFCNWLHNGQPTGMQDTTTTEDGAYLLNGATSATELTYVTRNPNAEWWIPSEDEWYKAAYHKNDGATANYFDYPTGSDDIPNNILADPDPGNHATFVHDSRPGEPYGPTIGAPYYRTEVGAHENSPSPYGTFDQGGNVSEWNESIPTSFARGVRDSSYNGYFLMMKGSERRYAFSFETNEYGNLGFRVASAVPEPHCFALLSCFIAYVLNCRRRR